MAVVVGIEVNKYIIAALPRREIDILHLCHAAAGAVAAVSGPGDTAVIMVWSGYATLEPAAPDWVPAQILRCIAMRQSEDYIEVQDMVDVVRA